MHVDIRLSNFTTRPRLQNAKLTVNYFALHAQHALGKPVYGQWSTSNKHVTLMSSKLEPMVWLHNTGQGIPSFDSCQLIITWISIWQ